MREKRLHIEKGNLISREMLMAYIGNKLSADEKSHIDKQLAEDPFLSDAVEGLKLADPETVNRTLDKIFHDIDIITGAKKPFVISKSVKMYAVAATMLVFLSLTFLIIDRLNDQQQQSNIAMETEKKSSAIVPADTAIHSDMGGGSAEDATSIAGSQSSDEISFNKEAVVSNTIVVERNATTGATSVSPGVAMEPEIVSAVMDAEKKSEELSIGWESIGEKDDLADAVILDEKQLEAPFTLSNVATTNESYGVLTDKSAKDKKLNKERSKSAKTKADTDAGAISPAAKSEDADLYEVSGAIPDSTAIYTTPEIMPEFPGGKDSLINYLAANITYPQTTIESEGNVYVQFIVNENGSISEVAILKGLAPAYDIEVLRVISAMPNWIPGKQNGVPVKTKYVTVVKFSAK